MTHPEFVAAYTEGRIKVEVDPKGASRFVSARLLLPLVALPVLGAGVALALIGWIWTGLAVIAAGIMVPQLIKRGAAHFVFRQALDDPALYDEVTRSGVLRITLTSKQ
jgi:hypothetical protein